MDTLHQKLAELLELLLQVDDKIKILPFDKKIQLLPIMSGTQVPKSNIKIKQYFKGGSSQPKVGTSYMDVSIKHGAE